LKKAKQIKRKNAGVKATVRVQGATKRTKRRGRVNVGKKGKRSQEEKDGPWWQSVRTFSETGTGRTTKPAVKRVKLIDRSGKGDRQQGGGEGKNERCIARRGFRFTARKRKLRETAPAKFDKWKFIAWAKAERTQKP